MKRALEGIRVLEFSFGMAGPWIGRHMAYCGAEVIKVESRERPEVVRLYVPPWAPELGIQPQLSPWLPDWNGGKRFIALNLTHPDAVDVCKRLAAKCDVVVENYSAGTIDKLGLGYDVLRSVKPDIIMFGASGFGDTGPSRKNVTWGPNIEALSGLALLSGFPHRHCSMTQYAYSDVLAAMYGLFAIMCALRHRHETGHGQYINLSQLESTIGAIGQLVMEYTANAEEPRKLGNRSLYAAPHGAFRCAGEDRYCAIAVENEEQWSSFCDVIGRPDLRNDERFATLSDRLDRVDELEKLVEEWTASRVDYEVMREMQAAGVPAGVVQNAEDMYTRDPQLAARRFYEEAEHLKKGKAPVTGLPLGLTETPGRPGLCGQPLGYDNDYVFSELLGMDHGEIQRLTEAGAIEQAGTK